MKSFQSLRTSGYDSYHSRGCSTLKVDPALFQTNRDRLVYSLRKVQALENKKNPLVLLKGGEYVNRHCSMNSLLFIIHKFFFLIFLINFSRS